jgi:hypothetical protein
MQPGQLNVSVVRSMLRVTKKLEVCAGTRQDTTEMQVVRN